LQELQSGLWCRKNRNDCYRNKNPDNPGIGFVILSDDKRHIYI